MARRLLPDEVWQLVEPLLPERPARPKGGRPVIADRDVLTGILFMLKTGIAWEDLPAELGCGCGMTCLRRLREWQQSGLWLKIQRILQAHLPDVRRIDWSRVQARQRGAHDDLDTHREERALGRPGPDRAQTLPGGRTAWRDRPERVTVVYGTSNEGRADGPTRGGDGRGSDAQSW